MSSLFRRVLVALTLGTSASLCPAKFALPEDVPVERVLRTAEATLAKEPGSGQAHYTVARIHYLAFSRGTGTVPVYLPSDSREGMGIPSRFMTEGWLTTARWEHARALALAELGLKAMPSAAAQREAMEKATGRHLARLQTENWRPAPSMDAPQRARHAIAALQAFAAAIRIKPDPLFLLGLASLQEEIVDWKNAASTGMQPSELAAIDFAQAQATYLRAFRSAYPREETLKAQSVEGLAGMVSHEAGVGYLRLSDRNRGVVRSDAPIRDEITAALTKLRSIPRGAVTPIVFALEPTTSITPLLSTEQRVNFDLRGYGPTERWPWLQPTTALLVWDPAGRGEIISGRQLFGGYTFQIFRETGYDALAALDDDGSGELNGAELAGLRAWFDRNGDGRSEPAEVVDLAEVGIVGIDVRATGKDGIHPTNPVGLRLRDGGTLPTWDWIVSPVAGPN